MFDVRGTTRRRNRRFRAWWFAALAVWITVGCQAPLDIPPATGDGGRIVRVPSEVRSAVTRGVYWQDATRLSGRAPLLFQGTLTEAELADAFRDSMDSSLRKRQVPLIELPEGFAWVPQALPQTNTEYTWLDSSGVAELFRTRADEQGMRRVWPRTEQAGLAALYCSELTGEATSDLADQKLDGVALSPAPPTAGCWMARAEEGSSMTALHGSSAGVVFEPTWFASLPAPPQAVTDPVPRCSTSEPFAVGCVKIEDDRIQIQGPAYSSLWRVSGDVTGVIGLSAGEWGSVPGFIPDSETTLRVEVFPEFSALYVATYRLRTASLRPHVVLNEVMANPLGAEPAQEWIELFNDSDVDVSLAGFHVGDEDAEEALPAVHMEARSYLLLVNETFEVTAASEIVSEANVRLVRLPQLGKSGLSNAGETLHLSDSSGKVCSRFSSEPKPVAGRSVARRVPWDSDESIAAFQVHAPPGASPGSINQVGPLSL